MEPIIKTSGTSVLPMKLRDSSLHRHFNHARWRCARNLTIRLSKAGCCPPLMYDSGPCKLRTHAAGAKEHFRYVSGERPGNAGVQHTGVLRPVVCVGAGAPHLPTRAKVLCRMGEL